MCAECWNIVDKNFPWHNSQCALLQSFFFNQIYQIMFNLMMSLEIVGLEDPEKIFTFFFFEEEAA